MSFLDIWNNLLKFNEKNIFIVFDKDGNIWFGMKDLFRALGYNNLKKVKLNLKIPLKYVLKYSKVKGVHITAPPLNMQPHTKMFNESGLNYILANSKKPIAKDFMTNSNKI